MATASKKGGAPGPRVVCELKIAGADSTKDKSRKDNFILLKMSVASVLGIKPEDKPPTFDMKPKAADEGKKAATWKEHKRFRKVGVGDATYVIYLIKELEFAYGGKTKTLKSFSFSVPKWMNSKDIVDYLLEKTKIKDNIDSIKTPAGHRIRIALKK